MYAKLKLYVESRQLERVRESSRHAKVVQVSAMRVFASKLVASEGIEKKYDQVEMFLDLTCSWHLDWRNKQVY